MAEVAGSEEIGSVGDDFARGAVVFVIELVGVKLKGEEVSLEDVGGPGKNYSLFGHIETKRFVALRIGKGYRARSLSNLKGVGKLGIKGFYHCSLKSSSIFAKGGIAPVESAESLVIGEEESPVAKDKVSIGVDTGYNVAELLGSG